MKKSNHLLFSFFCFFYHLSQISAQNPGFNCNPRPSLECNKILNNKFSPNNSYNSNGAWNPFGLSIVDEWNASHGTANIFDSINYSIPPPFPGAGYARMYTGLDMNLVQSEGIFQKIPAVIAGKDYLLSFFTRREASPGFPNQVVDNFFIYLLHCSDVQTFNPNSYSVPPIPTQSQLVFCQTNLINTKWNHTVANFIPNDAYDLIWIFPVQNSAYLNQKIANVLFSFPEIIDISNFSAGNNPTPQPGSCLVTLGPNIKNCEVKNATFKWLGPNNQIIIAPLNQQIQVDASDPLNIGIWTLKMTISDQVITNNSCSNEQFQISSSVTVSACTPCSQPTISPSGNIVKCVHYETGPWLTLTTNLTSNIQWYENGVPINGEIYPVLNLNNNPNNGIGWPNCSSTITVKNTISGCISNGVNVTRKNFSSPQVYLDNIPPNGTPINYCVSTGGPIRQAPSITDTTTIRYWWEYPSGISIFQVDSSAYTGTITFPSYYQNQAIIIPKALDNGCIGATDGNYSQAYSINVYQNCRVENSNQLNLRPNPAINGTRLESSQKIDDIVIFDINLNPLSYYHAYGSKSYFLNTSQLRNGFYIIKIISNHKAQFIKLKIEKQ